MTVNNQNSRYGNIFRSSNIITNSCSVTNFDLMAVCIQESKTYRNIINKLDSQRSLKNLITSTTSIVETTTTYKLLNQFRGLQHLDNFCRSERLTLEHQGLREASDGPRRCLCQNKLTPPRRVAPSLISQRVYRSFHLHATRSSFMIKPRNLDEMD